MACMYGCIYMYMYICFIYIGAYFLYVCTCTICCLSQIADCVFYDNLEKADQCILILVFNGACNRNNFYGTANVYVCSSSRVHILYCPCYMYIHLCKTHVCKWVCRVIHVHVRTHLYLLYVHVPTCKYVFQ